MDDAPRVSASDAKNRYYGEDDKRRRTLELECHHERLATFVARWAPAPDWSRHEFEQDLHVLLGLTNDCAHRAFADMVSAALAREHLSVPFLAHPPKLDGKLCAVCGKNVAD